MTKMTLDFELDTPAASIWVLSTTAGRRLTSLTLATGEPRLGEWIEALENEASVGPLEELALGYGGFTLRRGPDRRWSDLTVYGSDKEPAISHGEYNALASLPADTLTRLEVKVLPPDNGETATTFETIAKRQTRLVDLVLPKPARDTPP